MRHKRRLRRRILKKQRKIIVTGLFIVLLCFSAWYGAFSANINMNVKGDLKDKARVIQSWSEFANTNFHTTFYKENIVNITFLDSAVVPSNAVSMYALFCDDINLETLDLSSFNTSNVASMKAMFMGETER